MTPSTTASAGAVRRAKGFGRYAVSVQYHGGSFLGFTYQGPHREDCVVEQRKKSGRIGKVDLRGYRSVEGRLREALDDLFGKKQWENIQASSRTDRGVHALKNTFHVDIKMPEKKRTSGDDGDDKENKNGNADATRQQQQQQLHTPTLQASIERKLKDGLNFYLSRQSHGFETNHHPKAKQNPMMNELRILNASKSPEYMDNPYALTKEGKAKKQTFQVDWNARFSATQRTYVYRILCYCPRKEKQQQQPEKKNEENVIFQDSFAQRWDSYSIPFEWDRAWCLPQSHYHPLDVKAMKEAAKYLVGTHNFSSFRGRLCQRKTPIVTMESVTIDEASPFAIGLFARDAEHEGQQEQKLVTITFVANSFLYRQVRNMVGCLVEVGKYGGKLSPKDVGDLLRKPWNHEESEREHLSPTKFKHRPYSTAPPQGLFLVDVQHQNFRF
mmetsp:Transcript_17342/g.35760  ORF Transcript_17342/g.35760 Transcript_17342/m.35760 type:complete len:441 (-) Transcript_17342:218-1540(-)